MKLAFVILLFLPLLSLSQVNNPDSASFKIRVIDSIFFATKHNSKLKILKSRDSSSLTNYFIDRKSKELLGVDMVKVQKNSKYGEWRYIYVFNKEQLVKLFIHQYTKKNKYLREEIYFSDNKIILRKGNINPQYDLEKPLSYLNIIKSNLKLLL